MAIVAFVISLFVAVLGAIGVFSPMRLLGIVRQFQSPAGLYVAAILRAVLGAALLLAAPASHFPEIVRIIGIIIFVSGLVTTLLGIERFRRILHWWSARGPAFMRLWAGFAFVFGLFLAYNMVP